MWRADLAGSLRFGAVCLTCCLCWEKRRGNVSSGKYMRGGMVMLKVTGGCMIFIGCLGLGLWYREQLNGRIKALRSLRNILELLASEVRYGRAALPECCVHIARYVSPPFADAFLEI